MDTLIFRFKSLRKKSIFLLTLPLILFFGLDFWFHPRIHKFCPYDVYNSMQSSPEWDIPEFSFETQNQLRHILNQKFFYHDKGTQSYVFLSEDGKYILKFFKQRSIRPQTWLACIPFEHNSYYQKQKKRFLRGASTFSACTTAYKELKNETGLLYVHINQSQNLFKPLLCIDASGKSHSIDLDKTCFCIQEYADLIYPRITHLMNQNQIDSAKNVISSVFTLIETLGKKGVADNDAIIYRNFALLKDKAIQIDIGELRIDPARQTNHQYKHEVIPMVEGFKNWIAETHPSLSAHFEECQNHVLREE